MTTRYHASAPGLGDVLAGRRAGRHAPRTGVPIRRGSLDVDDEKCRRYSLPFHEEEQAAFLRGAEQFNLDHKQEGKYVGPFRGRGMDVLRWLLRQAKASRGRLCPSHAQIAEALKIGLRTVRRIMKALFLAGFLEWQRRSVVKDEDGGECRQQTSNLYRFNVPHTMAGLISRLVAVRSKRAPGPLRMMRIVGSAELKDRPDAWQRSLIGDSRLAGVLASLAAAIDARA